MDWRKIPGYENYEVSSAGQVRRDGKILSQMTNRWGYKILRLCKDGIGKGFKVHRLVALAFIPQIDEKPEVDHINQDRLDNRVENLRWNDRSGQTINKQYPQTNTGHKHIRLYDGVYVVQIRRRGIKYYESFKILPEAIAARDNYLISINL